MNVRDGPLSALGSASSDGVSWSAPVGDTCVDALADIKSQPTASFFLGPTWYETCIEEWTRVEGLSAVAIRREGGVPARALVGSRTLIRNGLRVRTLALNESLDAARDEVTVEHNGLYCRDAKTFGPSFRTLLADLGTRHDWDELRVSGLSVGCFEAVVAAASEFDLRVRTTRVAPTYWVDLDAIRESHGGDYLSALSSNTRQNLRRARRALTKELGQPELLAPGSVEEAVDWLERLGTLHRLRWGDLGSGGSSGFAAPAFVSFHRSLVRRAYERGELQLTRLAAGGRPIAYVYNVVQHGHVHFLLGAADYDLMPKARPGMLSHWMAIEEALRCGAHRYDFLAGEAQYKASLSTGQAEQYWVTLWRPRVRLVVEDLFRRARRRWRSHRLDPNDGAGGGDEAGG